MSGFATRTLTSYNALSRSSVLRKVKDRSMATGIDVLSLLHGPLYGRPEDKVL